MKAKHLLISNLILFLLVAVLSASYCFGQTPEASQTDAPFLETRPCKVGTNKAFFEITTLGDIQIRPCTGRSIFLNGSIFTGTGTPAGGAAFSLLQKNAANTAAEWSTIGGDVSGRIGDLSVFRLRGRTISATAPSNNQVLTWNNGASEWQPSSIPASGDITGAASTQTASGSPVWKDENGGILYFRELLGINGIATTWDTDTIFISGAALQTQIDTANATNTTQASQISALTTSKAGLDSPIFINTPLAPTATAGTNNTQIANTAFVQTATAINGDVQGTLADNHVVKVQGKTYQNTTYQNLQFPAWDASTNQFVPTSAPTALGTAGGDLTSTFPNPIVSSIQGRNITLTPEPAVFLDEFTGVFDTAKWNIDTPNNTHTQSGGFLYLTTTGTFGNLILNSDNAFDFSGKTAIWDYDYTGHETSTINDNIISFLVPSSCLSSANNCGYATGFNYRPNFSPNTVQIRYQFWNGNGGTFVQDIALSGKVDKFKLVDTGGTMQYWVMYVNDVNTWTLIHTYDYTGSLYDTSMYLFTQLVTNAVTGAQSPKIDRIETDIYATADSISDKSLIWYNQGASRFQDVSLSSFADSLFEKTITAPGTTGNRTINTRAGTVNFAPGTSNITVTNSLVTANSIITAVKRDTDPDATCQIDAVVPSSGSFSIILQGGCTDETSFGFVVH